MLIELDHPKLASSEGTTYKHSYAAPPELAINLAIKAINNRLLRSQSEDIDNNRL
jgi:hypothetical protein